MDGPESSKIDIEPVIVMISGREKEPGKAEEMRTEVVNVSQLVMLESWPGVLNMGMLVRNIQSVARVTGQG